MRLVIGVKTLLMECKGLQMSSRFVANLKRMADLKRKMDEMYKLGKLLKR